MTRHRVTQLSFLKVAGTFSRLALALGPVCAALLGCGASTDATLASVESSTASVRAQEPALSVSFALNPTLVSPWPKSVAVGDVDADGFLDAVVGHRDLEDVHVLYGNGEGQYASRPSQLPLEIEGFPYYVALADLDGDEAVDLIVSDMTNKRLKLFRNEGGGFAAAWTAELKVDVDDSATNRGAESPMALAVADFNQDDHVDIVAFQREDDAAFVFHNPGDGTLNLAEVQRIMLPFKATPWAALAVDIDGTGGLDVAFTQVEDGRGSIDGSVGFLLNTAEVGATASFRLSERETPVGRWPYDIDSGDFDGNGLPDLAVANGNSKSATLLTRTADHPDDGEPYVTSTLAAGNNPKDAQIADFDEDGDDDVVIANHLSSDFTFYFNCGSGSFVAETLPKCADLGRPIGMKKARDNDGRWDILLGSAQTGRFFSLKNLGATKDPCEAR